MAHHRLDRRQILKGAAVLGAGGALAALQRPTASLAGEDGPHGLPGLPGTWMETITITGGISFPPFHMLITYDGAGGLVGSTMFDLNRATLQGPSHGAWVRTGDRAFRWTLQAFLFAPDGTPSGLGTADENSTLDATGATYSGSGTFQGLDLNGQVTSSGTYTVVATRITVQV